jgi:LuxR family maltose regulon positive regulatory protein
MATPLLTTKLYVPSSKPNLVERPRLVKRLDEGLRLGHRLTLISAPAGFGKTTLIAEWGMGIAESFPNSKFPIRYRMAWLSLDEGDNDLARFLSYFVAALQSIEARQVPAAQQEPVGVIGEAALSAFQAPQPPEMESILTSLINEIAHIPDPSVLVLDDYHLIDAQPIHNALAFLLDHLPPTMHLVIASRADPPLPLPRLRIKGALTELHAAELAFIPEEIAQFIQQIGGLRLSETDVEELARRTEGWAAALQVTALSLKGQSPDRVDGFINTFTGGHGMTLKPFWKPWKRPTCLSRLWTATATGTAITGSSQTFSGSGCDRPTQNRYPPAYTGEPPSGMSKMAWRGRQLNIFWPQKPLIRRLT